MAQDFGLADDLVHECIFELYYLVLTETSIRFKKEVTLKVLNSMSMQQVIVECSIFVSEGPLDPGLS